MIVESWAIDFLFFVLLALLVVRDRRSSFASCSERWGTSSSARAEARFELLRPRFQELGRPRHQRMVAFSVRRRKQLKLVELAFLKSRRRRGEKGADLDRKEAVLRRESAPPPSKASGSDADGATGFVTALPGLLCRLQ